MSNKPIYRVVNKDSSKNRPFNWGTRYYFYNSHNENKNLDWFKDNLATAKGISNPNDITPAWTFDGKWDPESEHGPQIFKYIIDKDSLTVFFNEKVTVLEFPIIKSKNGKVFKYISGAGSNTLKFKCDLDFNDDDLTGMEIINDAKMIGNNASVSDRNVSFKIR